MKVQVPGTPDPAAHPRRVPGFPWWEIWHVCGGRTMFASNIEFHCPWAHLWRCLSRRGAWLQRRRRVRRRPRSERLAATWRRSGNRTERRIYECRHVTGSGRRLHPGRSAHSRHLPQRPAAPRGMSPRVRREPALAVTCSSASVLWD